MIIKHKLLKSIVLVSTMLLASVAFAKKHTHTTIYIHNNTKYEMIYQGHKEYDGKFDVGQKPTDFRFIRPGVTVKLFARDTYRRSPYNNFSDVKFSYRIGTGDNKSITCTIRVRRKARFRGTDVASCKNLIKVDRKFYHRAGEGDDSKVKYDIKVG